ncbi:velvet factor, partial [Dimargaris cristalligena]
FELVIVQQPIRARMCGFGDKDRRPCTPPPILKLLAFDRNNQPVDTESIDKSFLVVHVDLWSADRQTQQNLVLHPSLGQNLTASGDESPGASGSGPMYSVMSNDMSQSSPLSSPSNPRPQPISPPSTGLVASARNSSKMMEIRNLIGSPATSACKLYDTDGKLGIFFIFQDLSIRTEGTFTLKFSFVDIGTSQHQLNSGKDCVRFQVFSDPFTVYSAKKFPGMIESTPLSKCFVKQGIKISVRKE